MTKTNKPLADVLSPAERKYIALRARAIPKATAYKEAFNRPRMKPDSASARGCDLEHKTRIQVGLDDLLRSAKKSDLISHAKYLKSLLEDVETARAANHTTGLASLQRLVGQCIGSLSDSIVIEDRMTDEQLLQRIGEVSPDMAKHLSRLVGARDTFH